MFCLLNARAGRISNSGWRGHGHADSGAVVIGRRVRRPNKEYASIISAIGNEAMATIGCLLDDDGDGGSSVGWRLHHH